MRGGGVGAETVLCTGILILALFVVLSGPSPASRLTTAPPVLRTSAASPGAYFDHVVILMMENHAICDILTYCGGRGTYETQLANASGLATAYTSCGTSLLNYLCLTGGSTFGCDGNYDPNSNNCTALAWSSPNIVDRLIGANLTWRAYMENMTTNCLGANDGGYVVRHDPFVYYGDIVNNASRCDQVIPAGADDGALLGDLADPATAPNYMWLTPDLCNDMDKCPIEIGDAYLSNLVPQILGSPVFTQDRAALVVTFDEPSGGLGNPYMYTVWTGPEAKTAFTSELPYSHYSLLSTLEANWNLAPLTENDSSAANMSEFFVGPGPSFSLSAFPWNTAFPAGVNSSSTISLVAYNGFNGKVQLIANASPAGLTVSCAPSSIRHGETSTCTMNSATAGSYDVNITGVSGTLVSNVTIDAVVYAPLSAKFSFTPTSAFTGQDVTFTGRASGGVPPYNSSWDFGDGGTATGLRPVHVYASPGTYAVVLTLLDSIGLNATMTHNVTVAEAAPRAVTDAASGIGDTYATLHGELQSLGASAQVAVGFLTATSPTLAGATNWTAGSMGTTGSFSAAVNGLLANTTYYAQAWANGTGFASGTVQSFTTAVVPPGPLAAAFTISSANPLTGQDVTFTATASGGVAPFSFTWQFGDGGSGSGASVVHAYAAAGDYLVNLTASDSAGHTASAQREVQVSAPLPPAIPSSVAALQGTKGNNGWYTSAVVVTLSASDPRGPSVWVDYRVDQGSWVNYTSPFTLHDGKHLVEFSASDAYGGNAEAEHSLSVSVDTTPPALTVAPFSGVAHSSPVTIRWTGGDMGSGISEYTVQVDGGAFESAGLATSFKLDLPDGAHSIIVRAVDIAGNAATQSLTVKVDTNAFSPSGPYGGAPTYVALVLLAAVVLAVLLVRRRRRGRAS